MKASISVSLALLSVGESAELSKGLRVGVTAGGVMEWDRC
jgi:hypothetical protein